jgi:uncharacterized protein (TIGR00255 family)
MTGFGRATAVVDGAPHIVEIKAVNHRHLDLKIRLPRSLGALEIEIGRRVRARLVRGRVEVNVLGGVGEGGVADDVTVDVALARRVVAAVRQLGAAVELPGPSLEWLAQWPGVLVPSVRELDPAEQAGALMPAVDAALDALIVMRTNEGTALAAEVLALLDAIEVDRQVLVAAAPEQDRAYRERLNGRLAELLAAGVLEPNRVMQEVALFAERTDVAEELARLQIHLGQARALLSSEEAVGRRLDFLCQEMFREANTVGSKVQSAELTARVVDVKVRLEQFREQIQNVE